MAGYAAGYAAPLHSNVYVRNISPHVDEATLRALFEPYGAIDSLKLVPAKNPGGNSYAFVSYTAVESAQNAIAYLNNYAVQGITLEVKLANAPAGVSAKPASIPSVAIPNDNLYVTHVPVNYTEETLVPIFQQHGTVLSCKLLTGFKPHNPSLGLTAMVRMGHVDEATRAIQALNGCVLAEGTTPLVVKYADTPEQKALRKSRPLLSTAAPRYHPYGGAPTHPQATAAPSPVAYAPAPVQELHFAPQQPPPHMHQPAQPQPYGIEQPPHMHGPQPQYYPPPNPQQGIPPEYPQHLAPHGVGPDTYYPPPHMAAPNGHAGPPGGPLNGGPTASIFIRNLPPTADKLYLYETFAHLGAIKSVKTLLKDDTGLCNGIGFVNFVLPEAAAQAVNEFHNATVGDKTLHVALQPTKVQRNSGFLG